MLDLGPTVIDGRQYEWSYSEQEYTPTEIYHIGNNVYKNNGGRDILSRQYWNGLSTSQNRYSGAVYGPDGTANWSIVESTSSTSKLVQVKNNINGQIGYMDYTYGDKTLVDNPDAIIIPNPKTHQFVVDRTGQVVSKDFVIANKNRVSGITGVDGNSIGQDGWVDSFTYDPDFSKPNILSSPVNEQKKPKVLTFPSLEGNGITIYKSPIGQDLGISKLGGFDLTPPKLSDYIQAYGEHPVWGKDVPKDEQTILGNGTFTKINRKVKGASIYKKGKQYFYRDTLHRGDGAHLEVFDRYGNHIGEADPITGEIKEGSQDPKKSIKKELK